MRNENDTYVMPSCNARNIVTVFSVATNLDLGLLHIVGVYIIQLILLILFFFLNMYLFFVYFVI